MELYTGKEMKQLRHSNRWERVEATRAQWCAAIRDGWFPLNKNVMLTWWRRWQHANPASGIWQPLSKEQSQSINRVTWNRQSHTTVFWDSRLQHFQIFNTTFYVHQAGNTYVSGVGGPLYITNSGIRSCWSVWLWCLRKEPYIWSWHLIVIKTCHICFKYIMHWKFKTLFWPEVLTTLLLYREWTEWRIQSA